MVTLGRWSSRSVEDGEEIRMGELRLRKPYIHSIILHDEDAVGHPVIEE